MQEFHEGDLVEAVKGEAVMRARLVKDGEHLRLNPSPYFIPKIEILLKDGYTVTVVEKAAAPLPTEPGVYITPSGSQDYLAEYHTDHHEVHYLNTAGNWCDIGWGAPLSHDSLTRLEPVPVIAKRVLDDVKAASTSQPGNPTSAWRLSLDSIDIAGIAAEFGVTE